MMKSRLFLTMTWWDNIKTVSLKAWIKKNDTKYSRPILDKDNVKTS